MTFSDERIREIGEVIGLYEVSIEGVEPRLKIKIVKHEGMGLIRLSNQKDLK